MTQKDTKTRILDAAENLFAGNGFHNTSLRAITKEARVNIAAVNYHFGSKEALIGKVFERRFLPINEIRTAKLEAIRETARETNRLPRVEETLRAFIEPVIHFREIEPGADAFITLVSRTMSEPDDRLREILMKHFRPLFFLCHEILSEALPNLPREVLFWRLQFSIGVMSHTLHMIEVHKMLPGVNIQAFDARTMTEHILSFVTAGMEVP